MSIKPIASRHIQYTRCPCLPVPCIGKFDTQHLLRSIRSDPPWHFYLDKRYMHHTGMSISPLSDNSIARPHEDEGWTIAVDVAPYGGRQIRRISPWGRFFGCATSIMTLRFKKLPSDRQMIMTASKLWYNLRQYMHGHGFWRDNGWKESIISKYVATKADHNLERSLWIKSSGLAVGEL